MEAAFEFAINGPNMEFALSRIREGRSVPAGLFIDIMTEKCQLINQHLHKTREFWGNNGQCHQHDSFNKIS